MYTGKELQSWSIYDDSNLASLDTSFKASSKGRARNFFKSRRLYVEEEFGIMYVPEPMYKGLSPEFFQVPEPI